ncbi:MAG: FliM/FliN family flagellar motor switch protein [Phycisphaerales bacterium]
MPEVNRLRVPIIVSICETTMTLKEFRAITPGSILELPKNADAELDLLAAERAIGTGRVVKVGENFGIRLKSVGEASTSEEEESFGGMDGDFDPEAFADALLAAQD